MPEARFFEYALDLLAIGGFDGKLQRVNPAWTRTLGWSEEELLAQPLATLFHPDDLERNVETLGGTATGAETVVYEIRLRCKDGSYRWVMTSVRSDREAGQVFIAAKDVQERRETEEQLRETEAALRFQIGLEDIVTRMSTRFLGVHEDELEDTVRDALAALCRYHGIDRGYVLTMVEIGTIDLYVEWWADGVERTTTPIPALPIDAQRFWVRTLRADQPVRIADVGGDAPAGSEPAMAALARDGVQSILFVPLQARGAPVGFMGFEARRRPYSWTDESVALMRTVGELFIGSVDRCRAEVALSLTAAEVEQRNEELERSNRELEQFASIVSHDLKSPLQVVRGFIELLGEQAARGGDAPGDPQTYVAAALRGTARMELLIDDLLAYSRAGHRPSEMVDVDLDITMQEVLADSAAMVTETAARVHVGSLPTVQGDPTQLRQLFQNLVTNAIKFRRTDVTPEVTVEAIDEGDHWVVTVTDNGIGVAPEHRTDIFGMFNRVHHGDRPGSGIGLAVCSRVVAHHGGQIWVESVDADGSRFRFTLAK